MLTDRASYNFMADPETLSVKGEPKYSNGKGDSGGATKRFFCGDCGRLVTNDLFSITVLWLLDCTNRPDLPGFDVVRNDG